MNREIDNPILQEPRNLIGAPVNTAQIHLGEDFYRPFREANEKMAAKSREEARLKASEAVKI